MEKDRLVSLVDSAKQGDSAAMDTLFSEFYNDVYYFALKTVKDSETACDITQETFLEIIRTIDKLQEPAAFVTWMKKIAYHQCTRYFKKKKDVLVEEDEDGNTIFDTIEDESSASVPQEVYEKDEFRQTIMSMVDELSEEQRSAVMLYYFDELSVGKIAEIQGVSEGTVKSRLNYARKGIKKSVEAYEEKHGIKLHSVAFLPLFLLGFGEKASMPPSNVEAISKVLSNATSVSANASASSSVSAAKSVAASAKAASKSAGIAAKVASLPIAAKVVAAVLAAAIVTGSVALGVSVAKSDEFKGVFAGAVMSTDDEMHSDSEPVVTQSVESKPSDTESEKEQNVLEQLDIVVDKNTIVNKATVHGVFCAVKEDGTVLFIDENTYGRSEIFEWTDISSIAHATSHSVGLKKDGTVVAVGRNKSDCCEVSDWKNIVEIAAVQDETYGLKNDGTVVMAGYCIYGKNECVEWTDIVEMCVEERFMVGLKSDGTAVSEGSNMNGCRYVMEWTDIVDIDTGYSCTVGVKSDGTVVYTGEGDFDISPILQWTDIKSVSVGNSCIAGLKNDGTVVTVSHGSVAWDNDLSGLTDIEFIYTGTSAIICRKTDGSTVYVGNPYGCFDSPWLHVYDSNGKRTTEEANLLNQ